MCGHGYKVSLPVSHGLGTSTKKIVHVVQGMHCELSYRSHERHQNWQLPLKHAMMRLLSDAF